MTIDDHEDADAVPRQVVEEFASDKAEPRVVKTYTPPWGLRRFRPPALFTNRVVQQLRQRGVLEVELRWRQVRRYVSLVPRLRVIRVDGAAIQAAEPKPSAPAERLDEPGSAA